MSWAGTVLAVAAISGGATTLASVYQGNEQRKLGKKSLESQERAQRETFLSTLNDEKRAAQADRKANRRKPDVASILFQERAGANQGAGATILGGGDAGLLGSKTTLMG